MTYRISLFLVFLFLGSTIFCQPASSEDSAYEPAIPENVPPTDLVPVEVDPCPDDPGTGAPVVDMYGNKFWTRDPSKFCTKLEEPWKDHSAYCRVNALRTGDWNKVTVEDPNTVCCSKNRGEKGWKEFLHRLDALDKANPDACFSCACIRGDAQDGGDGCFPPGVQISMGDGSTKSIEDVRVGDMVWNPRTKEPLEVKQVIEGPEKLPLIRLGFADTVVTVSQQHPILTKGGVRQARELKLGDSIYDARGEEHALTVLEQLPVAEGQRVINLVLDADGDRADQRMMISGGIITGDIMLQKKLAEERKD